MSKTNSRLYHNTVISIVIGILLLPIVATFLYSISTRWGATILPDGLTLNWYLKLLTEERFLWSFVRSLGVCFAAMGLCIVLMLPAIFVVYYRLRYLKFICNMIVILPFAVPPVVGSVGLIQIYSDGLLPISGTFWILIFTYFTVIIPFVYRSIVNSLEAINYVDMIDAAKLLGANTFKAFIYVVLPNLKKGLLSAIFISISILIGEFVFANILAGTRFETLQVYLYNTKAVSGHYSSALVIFYFAFIFVFTYLASVFSKVERKSVKRRKN